MPATPCYALGIHPLYVDRAPSRTWRGCARRCTEHRDDPRLVAVGEIGLDHFVPGLDRERQERFYLGAAGWPARQACR